MWKLSFLQARQLLTNETFPVLNPCLPSLQVKEIQILYEIIKWRRFLVSKLSQRNFFYLDVLWHSNCPGGMVFMNLEVLWCQNSLVWMVFINNGCNCNIKWTYLIFEPRFWQGSNFMKLPCGFTCRMYSIPPPHPPCW